MTSRLRFVCGWHELRGPAWRAMIGAFLLALGLPLLGPGATEAFAAATTYYADQANPNCSDSGPGTQSQPFCTIGAGAARVTAGQTVLVLPGTYEEDVQVLHSGTSVKPILIQAQTQGTVSVVGGTHGFSISNRKWVIVSGFDVTGASDSGIYVAESIHIAIRSNTATGSGQPVSGGIAAGIEFAGVTKSTIAGNTVSQNTEAGISLAAGTSKVNVIGNVTYDNAAGYTRLAPGIDVRGTANMVKDNVTYGNEDSGLQFYPGAANNLVVDNVAYSNGDHGIDDLQAPDQVIVGNTVYANVTAGINLEGSSPGGTLRNNISVDNGINSPRTSGNIRVDGSSTSGTTLDRDLIYLGSPSTEIVWGSSSYSSLAAFQAATSMESGGLEADPLWVNPALGDFRLSLGSLAIDSADSGAPGEPLKDVDGVRRADVPSVPNTGVGPRAYDDRGAYEYPASGSRPSR
jgi:parallel beta-helix repeat protein